MHRLAFSSVLEFVLYYHAYIIIAPCPDGQRKLFDRETQILNLRGSVVYVMSAPDCVGVCEARRTTGLDLTSRKNPRQENSYNREAIVVMKSNFVLNSLVLFYVVINDSSSGFIVWQNYKAGGTKG